MTQSFLTVSLRQIFSLFTGYFKTCKNYIGVFSFKNIVVITAFLWAFKIKICGLINKDVLKVLSTKLETLLNKIFLLLKKIFFKQNFLSKQ